jgi:peroxiredoxin
VTRPTKTTSSFVALLVAATALAQPADPRGWSEGTVAIDAAKVIAGHTDLQTIELPRTVSVSEPTVLVYFSPTCPHCMAVAAELEALHQRLVKGGWGRVVGVASSSSTPEALRSFREVYGIRFDIVTDSDRAIASAMGVRSTPSAMLVRPDKGRKVTVVDLWYPYLPGFDSLVEGRARGDVMAVFEPGRFHGSTFCGTCHGQEHQAWQLTHHAVAWRTLERKKATADAECVGCHVTGMGQPGGWTLADGHESKLVDVGCESCHSAGGPHDGEAPEATSTCVGCHDAKHSIAFDLSAAVPLIDHYAGVAMSDDDRRARRMALFDGSAPQELVRFPSGENVGAAKCLSCHPTEHTAWLSDPHRRAMKTLKSEGKHDDPACVRCHATAKQSGPPPDAVSDYHLLDGVGCESCHGPGAAHVAAEGGTDNIEGLGEDCPVCVIEAVCTSCHTAEMDPDWNLEVALPKVSHGATPR